MKFSLSNTMKQTRLVLLVFFGGQVFLGFQQKLGIIRCGSWMVCHLKQRSFPVGLVGPPGRQWYEIYQPATGALTALQTGGGSHFSLLSGSWASVCFKKKKLTEKRTLYCVTPTNYVTLEELNILPGIIKRIPKLHFASLYEIAFPVTTVFSCHKM